MSKSDHRQDDKFPDLVTEVDTLSEETKDLALNLALYLAKAKSGQNSEKIREMEPQFIRLVNGTVNVVGELTTILNAARHQEKMIYQLPSGKLAKDHIEQKLESIVSQCNRILSALTEAKDLIA